jgi:hypothetical protein
MTLEEMATNRHGRNPLGIPAKTKTISGRTRTAFRGKTNAPSERSDAGTSIVSEPFVFVKNPPRQERSVGTILQAEKGVRGKERQTRGFNRRIAFGFQKEFRSMRMNRFVCWCCTLVNRSTDQEDYHLEQTPMPKLHESSSPAASRTMIFKTNLAQASCVPILT